MTRSYFYDTSNEILIFIFIIVLVSIALIGLYIFIIFTKNDFEKRLNDQNTSTFLSVVAVAVALVIAFIISDEWNAYTDASSSAVQEANVIYLLYRTIFPLPGTEEIQNNILFYLCSIINTEFPDMQEGILPLDNVYLDGIQALLLSYIPLTTHDEILYSKAIDLLNQASFLRNKRLEASTASIPGELWWVVLIGFFVIVILIWFITGDDVYRILMTTFVTIVYAALLFLLVVLDYPYRGDFAVTSEPFQFVLNKLVPSGFDCSSATSNLVIMNNRVNSMNELKNKELKNKELKMKELKNKELKNNDTKLDDKINPVNICPSIFNNMAGVDKLV